MWKYVLIFMSFLFSVPVLAQTGRPSPSFDAEQVTKIEQARQAFITERLALTPAEAKAFFPVFWAYDQKIREARRKMFRRAIRSRDALGSVEMSEKLANEILQEDRRQRRAELELQLEAEDKYLEILPATKVVRLAEVEKEFRERLWEKTRAWRRGSGG